MSKFAAKKNEPEQETQAASPSVGFLPGSVLFDHELPHVAGGKVVVTDTFWNRERVGLLVEGLHACAVQIRHGASSLEQRRNNRKLWLAKLGKTCKQSPQERDRLERLEADDWEQACGVAGVLPRDVKPNKRKPVSLVAVMRTPRDMLTRMYARGASHWAIDELRKQAKHEPVSSQEKPTTKDKPRYKGAHSEDEDLFE